MHLADLNIGRLLAPTDNPRLANLPVWETPAQSYTFVLDILQARVVLTTPSA